MEIELNSKEDLAFKLIEIFKKNFEKMKSVFKDERELKYQIKSEDNFEPHIRCYWTEEYITIGIWPNRLINWLKETPIVKDLNFEALKDVFIQTARHEYGHTISFKSFYLDFPEEMQEIIAKKQITYTQEYNELYKSTKFNKTDEALTNIDLKNFKSIFLEFIANLCVFEKIEYNHSPLCLKMFLKTVELYLHTIFLIQDHEVNAFFFGILLNMHVLYIFQERFNDLENMFKVKKKLKLFEFLCYICQNFKKIYEINEDFLDMKEDIIEFGKFLNNLEYSSLLFTDQDKKGIIPLIKDYLDK